MKVSHVQRRPVLQPQRTAASRLLALGLFVLTANLLPAPLRAAGALACWTPDELRASPSERIVRKGIANAAVAPPDLQLATPRQIPPNLRGAIRRVDLPPGRKLVALTFDLCETPGEVAGYDGTVIDTLRAKGVKSTVFAGGRWMASHAERTGQLIADPRIEMASHGWGHRNVRLISGSDLRREIIGPSQQFVAARRALAARTCIAKDPAALSHAPAEIGLFRFPFGACNAAALEAVNDAGLLAIQWDVSTADAWVGQSADAIVATIVRQTRPGSIILGHANGRGHNMAAALPRAIERLQALGFEFVTVSELLAAGRPVVVPTCYDARPGDTDKYDFFAGRPAVRSRLEQGNGWGTTTVRP